MSPKFIFKCKIHSTYDCYYYKIVNNLPVNRIIRKVRLLYRVKQCSGPADYSRS